MRIVLIGASVRPQIASCLAAGCVPVAFDFFADWDGQQTIQESGCENACLTKIDRYEDLLELDFAGLGDAAILTGGAELRAELVSAVGEQIPLLGPSAESLTKIRDSLKWLQVLHESGCRVPQIKLKLPADYSNGSWLMKLSGTCGGSGVQIYDKNFKGFDVEGWLDDSYFQKRIVGQAWSAVLVSRRQTTNDSNATFSLGYTQQWLAADFADLADSWSRETSGRCPEVPQILANPATSVPHLDRPFAYRGSIGPLAVSESVQQQVEQMADCLARSFAMQGVWGIDFVLDDQGQVWPVDFNPRITASAELFESAIARSKSKFRSVIDLHLSACRSTGEGIDGEFEKLADDRAVFSGVELCEAKRIVFHYGSEPIEITKAIWELLSRFHKPSFFQTNQIGASVADVPRLGDRIASGRPLLTVRGRAKTKAAAIALMDELLDSVQVCVREIG